MRRRRGTGWWLVLALITSPILAACGDDDDAAATNATESPAANTGATAGAVRVTDVEVGSAIGSDRRVTGNDDLNPNDTIYVSVATEGTGSNASLTARWTFDDGQVVDESSQTLSPTGPANTEFHIFMPAGLPAGDYTVEILLNGQSVERETFEIEQ